VIFDERQGFVVRIVREHAEWDVVHLTGHRY
jgi:hypothetical protein